MGSGSGSTRRQRDGLLRGARARRLSPNCSLSVSFSLPEAKVRTYFPVFVLNILAQRYLEAKDQDVMQLLSRQ